MITAATSLRDVAGAVAAALRTVGYDPVVVGGSASTLHAPRVYASLDIDMVVVGGIDRAKEVVAAMASIGFSPKSGMFVHRKSPYTIDFVQSPVAIGDTVIDDFAEIDTPFGTVRVLHVTDAVCDRLNKYILWSDIDSLNAAVAVARECKIDLKRVADFIDRHSGDIYAEKYQLAHARFLRELAPRSIPEFSFSTAFRARLAQPLSPETAAAVMTRIHTMLDRERNEIDDLAAVDMSGEPSVGGTDAIFPLSLRSARNLSLVEKMRVAIDTIDHLRGRLDQFPELIEIPEDVAPPIATT